MRFIQCANTRLHFLWNTVKSLRLSIYVENFKVNQGLLNSMSLQEMILRSNENSLMNLFVKSVALNGMSRRVETNSNLWETFIMAYVRHQRIRIGNTSSNFQIMCCSVLSINGQDQQRILSSRLFSQFVTSGLSEFVLCAGNLLYHQYAISFDMLLILVQLFAQWFSLRTHTNTRRKLVWFSNKRMCVCEVNDSFFNLALSACKPKC